MMKPLEERQLEPCQYCGEEFHGWRNCHIPAMEKHTDELRVKVKVLQDFVTTIAMPTGNGCPMCGYATDLARRMLKATGGTEFAETEEP